MPQHIVLDSAPLSLLAAPSTIAAVRTIDQWSADCVAAGFRIYIPEVIDYELRRELQRAGKSNSIAKLDQLVQRFDYIPINTAAMRRAADLWAYARNAGIPTGDPKKLDIMLFSARRP